MPIKTSSGKWKWGNVERSSKKDLVQTVYGIWKKNGSKGSFSDFLKGTHEAVLNETKADLNNKIYFHGSASKSMASGKIEPPSLERPFYVTSDVDYAIAFSGKMHGNSGDTKRKFKNIKKSGQFVYVVSLSPTAEFFNFVDITKHPKDISKYFPPTLSLIIERAIKDWKYNDIYQFSSDLFFFIQGVNKYYRQYDNDKGLELTNDILFVENSPLSMKEYKAVVDEIVFDYQNNILNGIKDVDMLGKMSNEWMFKNIHNLMGTTLFKKMKEDGFKGIITCEEDINEQLNINVVSDNAIGIWDISALDKITTTPISVNELKKIYSGIETLKFDIDEHKREVNAKIIALIDTIQKKQNMNESTEEKYFVADLNYGKHIKPVIDILKKWKRMQIENITKHADNKSMKWFGIYKGSSIEDIVALAAVNIDKADKEIFFNQINSGEKGMGKFLTDKMIEYFKKNKNGCDHISWLSDPDSGEPLKDFYRKNFPDAEETEEKNEWWQTSKFTLKLKESIVVEEK